jgi:hyaluronan synthase
VISGPATGAGDALALSPGLGALGRLERMLAALGVLVICGLIAWHVGMRVRLLTLTAPMLYSVVVSGYVLSRFALAAAYRLPTDAGLEPSIAVIVPAFNEGEAVARTIAACMALDYPLDKREVICVNDGSTDDTLAHMRRAAASYPAGSVTCLDLGSNQGKRAAMAAGIRATSAEILVFVDSDSMPARDGVRRLVQGFADPRVGAVAGLTHARNADVNGLTRMQAARYFVSYQLLKAGESVLGAVSCCSGCFAAYRPEAVRPVLEAWERQRFLGTLCTYGDDRSLTCMVMREGWITRYDASAEAWTDVPDKYRKFFRQQLRWKKSWAREAPRLLAHLWRTRPQAFPFALVGTAVSFISPFVLFYNLLWVPAMTALPPMVYLLALYLVSMAYALLHRSLRDGGQWRWAFVGTLFYVAISAQIVWAVARLRDGAWGTRGG